MNWIKENKYQSAIERINETIRQTAQNTDYDDILSITYSSKLVRILLRAREQLYWEGLE